MNNTIKTQAVVCNNCNSSKKTTIACGVDFEYNTSSQSFYFVRCNDCSLVYLNPRPCVSELPKIYPDNYLAYNMSDNDDSNKFSLAHKLRYNFYTSKVRYALKFIKNNSSKNLELLDVGAGDGRLLNWYRTIDSHSINTHAVEMNNNAVDILIKQGHRVYPGLFSNAETPVNYFDIVHSSHVIEHVDDPKQFSAKSFNILKSGGLYLTETPNIDCIDAKFFRKKYWGGYHFPRHWNLYSPETVRKSLEDIGFEILEIRFFPNPVFWVWTLHHYLKDKGFPVFMVNLFPAVSIFNNSFGNVLRLGFFTIVDKLLSILRGGRMGTMQIIARKP